MSVDNYDESVAICTDFDNEYGIQFPTINLGSTICSAYNVSAFPSYILIAPDHSIVEQDMWPINSTSDFDNFIQPHGLAHQSCDVTNIKPLIIQDVLTLFPNPSKESVNINFEYSGSVSLKITNTLGKVYFNKELIANGDCNEIINLKNFSEGLYFVSLQMSEGVITKKLIIQ